VGKQGFIGLPVVVAVLSVACAPSAPLGDGTLTGKAPSKMRDVHRYADDIVLVLHDDGVPLPREIVVRRLPSAAGVPNDWTLIETLDVPAPQTRVGDRWQENIRRVRRYRRVFPNGQTFEADIETQLAESLGLRFLRGLRPSAR